MITRSKARSKKGQSLVELALVLPIILIILFGIMEFGRIFSAYLMISNASREGARYAVVGETQTFIENKIKHRLSALGSVEVVIEYGAGYADDVTVTVRHDFTLIVPIINTLISDTSTIKMEVSTTMRMESG